MTSRFLLPLFLLVCACSGSAPATQVSSPAPEPAAAPEPPGLRLPDTLSPTGYRVRLAIDPARADFSGSVEMEAELRAETDVLWLNAHGLEIDEAEARRPDAAPVSLVVAATTEEHVGLRAPSRLSPGPLTVAVRFRGRLDEVDTYGAYRQKDRGDWYVYTQFETMGARRVFPGVDEPVAKVPWELSLEVPEGQTALSNTPIVSETPTGTGTKVATFARTKPLPTYLLTFAVGPFEIVDAGKTRTGVPVRIVTMRGRAADAAWAVESTLPLVTLLEDYFGTPYPYAKLDSIAIPLTVGFGAMEHPGLITYTERLLLVPQAETTERTRRRYAYVGAHELAHQWFGNLVTPVWWDDIWLNEAFATWMERWTIEQFHPAWDPGAISAEDTAEAMRADALASARRIREPIGTADDVTSAFDSITYEKGAAVLHMFEQYLGPEVFQRGVRKYLADNAWGNATVAQFLEALGAAAGQDVYNPFATFLDQSGVPLVRFELSCGQGAAPGLRLSQSQYAPRGSSIGGQKQWQVPVCVEYDASGEVGRQCVLLSDAHGELPMPGARGCPAWVMPNADGVGYYHAGMDETMIAGLLGPGKKHLSVAERMAVVRDVGALAASGALPPRVVLEVAGKLADDPSRFVVEAVRDLLVELADAVPDDAREGYARVLRGLWGARAARLGWKAPPDADEDALLVRKAILPLMVEHGRDEKLAASAVKQARAWLADRGAVPRELVEPVLRAAARRGDARLFDELVAAARETRSRRVREELYAALGSFGDPALRAKALALVLDEGLDIRESSDILWSAIEHRDSRAETLAFVNTNREALLARLPEQGRSRLAKVVAAQCVVADGAEALLEILEATPSGPRRVAQAREQMQLCAARRAADAEALRALAAVK